MNSLSDFLRVTKTDFLKDASDQKVDRWTVVMGNEAGDLDSIASSIAYSYLSSRYHKEPTIALIQTPRTDLYLRPENLYAFTLARLSHDQQELLCIDDVPPSTLQGITKFALVDHNRLLDRFQGGSGKVIGIIDHHADEKQHLDANPREIVNPVGSCASLVTRHFKDDWDDDVPPELATLLLSSIYIDTSALKAGDKAVDIDYDAAKFLLPKSTFDDPKAASGLHDSDPTPSIDDLFDELSDRKRDVSQLSTRDLLRRDYKEFLFGQGQGYRTGLATVPLSLDSCISASTENAFWESIEGYMAERNLAVLGMLTSFKGDKTPKHKRPHLREILMVIRPEAQVPEDVQKRLFDGMESDRTLDLVPKEAWAHAGLLQGKEKVVRVWDQRNAEASRKYTAPLVKRLIEGEGSETSVAAVEAAEV